MSNTQESSSASAASPYHRVAALADDVSALKSQIAEVLAHIKTTAQGPAASPSVVPDADPPAPAVEPVSAPVPPEEVYKVGALQYSVPPPFAAAVSAAVSIRSAYSEKGKLNHYLKPSHIPLFPSKRFIPEDVGRFGRIKAADTRDGWESEVLWNIGNNTENALASSHRVAEALAANEVAAVTEAFAVLNHHIAATYERINERFELFSDALESGKSEAILLQKYLREDDQPYQSSLYRATKSKFAELRSHAYAKEINKQTAASSTGRRNTNYGRNNNNRGSSSAGYDGNKNAASKDRAK